MIKASVKHKTTKVEFPCLMQYRGSKQIVLFEKYGTGTRLSSDVNATTIGYRATNWRMDEFEVFTGTLEMRNGDL